MFKYTYSYVSVVLFIIQNLLNKDLEDIEFTFYDFIK